VENPIHFKYVSVEGGEKGSKKLPVSNPRVFVVVEEGGEVGIIEEFVSKEGNDDRYYWANPVLEVVIGKGAKVRHSYVQSQSLNSAHIKWTAVRQVISFGFFSYVFVAFLLLFSNLLNIVCLI
jgi:Fe-S cluster assembly protein SufD